MVHPPSLLLPPPKSPCSGRYGGTLGFYLAYLQIHQVHVQIHTYYVGTSLILSMRYSPAFHPPIISRHKLETRLRKENGQHSGRKLFIQPSVVTFLHR